MKIKHILTLITATIAIGNAQDQSILDSFALAKAPENALQISEVFKDPSPGKKVVLSGEVMGRMDPFIKGRAMVTLGDPTKITPCNRIPGDSCETPWDVCCDDPEVIKKSIATIQILNQDGRVLKAGLKGYKGIKELSFLTVVGTIAKGSNANNLLIDASAFHVAKVSPYKDAAPVSAATGQDKVAIAPVAPGDVTYLAKMTGLD
jgi:hypothetical protein